MVIIISLILVIVLPVLFSQPAFCSLFEVHKGYNVGEAIGGITAPVIGIFSILLLCITLKSQKDAANLSAFENRCFKLVELHRKNVEEMYSEARDVNGQYVIYLIQRQIGACVEDTKDFFDNTPLEGIIKDSFRKELIAARPDVDILSFIKIDIAYSIVCIGVKDESLQTLESLLSKRYQESFVKPLVLYLHLKPADNKEKAWDDWTRIGRETLPAKKKIVSELFSGNHSEEVLNKYPDFILNNHKVYYWGHQFRLGHYFRHLYASVEYIDKQGTLLGVDPYEYVRLLRSQLSETEQIVFMANSISDMGGEWELFRKEEDGKQYITKYGLIKNISQKEVFGIGYRSFYPDVDYEFKFDS